MKPLVLKPSKSGKVFYFIGKYGMKLLGWKVEGSLPDLPQMVIIAAPHTSNWDFLYMMGAAYVLRAKFSWMGKDNLFKGPFGIIMRWFGGLPVNRRVHTNLVGQVVEHFRTNKKLILVIPPEGTRKKTDHWHSGFYYIAKEAGVPLVLAYIDYKRRVVGIGPTINPSEDIQTDMAVIKPFYSQFTGKHPERMGDIRINPK
jgi:1-acyl-sn-glycerol-3-phosphate acyltransferase